MARMRALSLSLTAVVCVERICSERFALAAISRLVTLYIDCIQTRFSIYLSLYLFRSIALAFAFALALVLAMCVCNQWAVVFIAVFTMNVGLSWCVVALCVCV